MAANPKKGTFTSKFGVSRRENHDSSDFYARFIPPRISKDSIIDGNKAIDEIFVGDARCMPEIPDNSVALVVTSPPYFAGKEYEQELGKGFVPGSYVEYLQMLEDVLAETTRKLEPGGRLAINVANLGRKPYRSLSADVIGILQDKLRLLLRAEIIWQKARGSSGSCAWGSFQRPSNPVVRDLTERVLVAGKGRFDRALTPGERRDLGLPWQASIGRDEFMEATTDVWEIPAESAGRIGHPAPFPIALPQRLIELYTYYDDLVLDPFAGSGTTAAAAIRTGRHFAAYDTDESYVAQAQARVRRERLAMSGDGDEGRRSVAPEGIRTTAEPARSAKEIAAQLLAQCGFSSIEPEVRLARGVEVSFRAQDRSGRSWLFEVCGGFTSTLPGLKRQDTLWKAIGKSALIRQIDSAANLVLLTSEPPAKGSAAEAGLRLVCGPGKPISMVIGMLCREDHQALRVAAKKGPPTG